MFAHQIKRVKVVLYIYKRMYTYVSIDQLQSQLVTVVWRYICGNMTTKTPLNHQSMMSCMYSVRICTEIYMRT